MSYSIVKHNTNAALKELIEMLGTRRVANSRTEKRFIATYIDSLPGMQIDGFGNRYITVGGSAAPPILWTSHTDSVHSYAGNQSIIIDNNHVRLAPIEIASNCLGADDATGVWLMRHMIKRQIPGHYIFHRLEESGGLGSSHIAKHERHLLDGIQIAIALDRKGYSSVITRQEHICASNAFALSIASQLPGSYEPDDTGLFTDTANYTDIIPECSNLSVGYSGAHSRAESQDIGFAVDLLDSLCSLDVSRLVIERDPNTKDSWSDYYSDDDNWFYDSPLDGRKSTAGAYDYESLLSLCLSRPDAVADYLEQFGVSTGDIVGY